MSIFTSQFDRARRYADAYAGESGDPGWRPAVAVAGLAGAGAVVVAAAGAEAATGDDWGEGWDAGWDSSSAGAGDYSGADDASWMDRGDYTDAGVGGDDDFFYFIDGDSSLTIG
jgi:hypothetical protein